MKKKTKTYYATIRLTEKELDALLSLCNEHFNKAYDFGYIPREEVEKTKAIDRAADNICDAMDEISEKKERAQEGK